MWEEFDKGAAARKLLRLELKWALLLIHTAHAISILYIFLALLLFPRGSPAAPSSLGRDAGWQQYTQSVSQSVSLGNLHEQDILSRGGIVLKLARQDKVATLNRHTHAPG